MFIPSTFKRPVSSWKALNLRKTLLMASSVRLKPLNCSRLPCVYAQETLTFLLTQKDRKSGSAGMPRPISYAVFCLKKKTGEVCYEQELVEHDGTLFCAVAVARGMPAEAAAESGTRYGGV